MKFATFNANSIRARLPIIEDWLKRERPHILCLQETKVQDKDFPTAPFEAVDYRVVFRGQKSYNGVAIVTRLPIKTMHIGLYDGEEEQARFISAIIGDIPVINVYVPQGLAPGTDKFDYKLRWLTDLLSHIQNHFRSDEPVLLTGDFNVALEPIDVFDPDGLKGEVGFHPEEQALMRAFLDWGFVDLFRTRHPEGGHFTFWDYRIPNAFKRKMGWRIDYILATPPVAEKCQRIWIDSEARQRQKPSDHTFLVAEFDLTSSY